MYRSEIRTKGDYPLDEVTSALQKCIRRGLEEEAMFWALELCESGLAQYAWRRLMIISFEDIGVGAPEVCRLVVAGWLMTKASTKTWKEPKLEALGTVLLAMCRAPKNREGDDFTWFIMERRQRGWTLAIPAFAVDDHTERGRQLKRGRRFWFEEASKLVNAVVIEGNKYGAKVRELFAGLFNGEKK